MKVVVMAAGRGSRLMPLTEDIPKAMVKIKGTPIIKWTLDTLKEIGIDDIIIITGYKCGTLKSFIKYNIVDMKIKFIHQRKLTGTADAIALAKDYIKEDFLVLTGDIIYQKDDILKLMQLRNSLLYTKQNDRLYEFGTLDMAGNNIRHINEKATNPTSNLINCAGYHFTPTVFPFINKTLVDKRFEERIITNTINLMIDNGVNFQGIKIKELNEISRIEDIERVERRI